MRLTRQAGYFIAVRPSGPRAAANRQKTRCWLQPALTRRLPWVITAFMLTATAAAAVHRGDPALGACSGENPSPIATKQRSLSL